MDEKRIELAEPKLVPMRPKERADAARLLAALILAACGSREGPAVLRPPASDAACSLPMDRGTSGNPDPHKAAGDAA